jgi:hypothetical protein
VTGAENKIGVVVPYFGNLPKMFDLWLKSAANNAEIDFHLVGDCFDLPKLPPNVFVHELDFQALNRAIINNLGGRPLSSPYKLCDFKPTYAILFPEILERYKIWGFSDLDLLYGKLSNLIKFDTFPEKWGRLFDLGHLSFFPNVSAVNRAFERPFAGLDTWPFIRDSRIVWVFDEHHTQGLGGVNARLGEAGYDVIAMRDGFADIVPWHRGFVDKTDLDHNIFFIWSAGRIWRISKVGGELRQVEVCYAHFQKRQLRCQQAGDDLYFLTPQHWGEVKSLEQGIHMLEDNFETDMKPYISNKLSPGRKARKWLYFGLEVVSVRSGIAALSVLAKNFLARGGEARK